MGSPTVNDNRTLEEIKADIYEAAALGYDQKEAQRWAKQQLDEAIKKIAKREIPKSLEENILTQRGAV